MKIYTKKGDTGETALFGGSRVPKYHARIEAYGTVDELNSFLGLLRDQDIDKEYLDFLLFIQERLFTAGSTLAADPSKGNLVVPDMNEDDITRIEQSIDKMEDELPPLKNFILPGGHTAVSHCHVARCVCRRAERKIVALNAQEKVPEIIIRFMNRLSDYLFVLARKVALDLGVDEIPWVPRKPAK